MAEGEFRNCQKEYHGWFVNRSLRQFDDLAVALVEDVTYLVPFSESISPQVLTFFS